MAFGLVFVTVIFLYFKVRSTKSAEDTALRKLKDSQQQQEILKRGIQDLSQQVVNLGGKPVILAPGQLPSSGPAGPAGPAGPPGVTSPTSRSRSTTTTAGRTTSTTRPTTTTTSCAIPLFGGCLIN